MFISILKLNLNLFLFLSTIVSSYSAAITEGEGGRIEISWNKKRSFVSGATLHDLSKQAIQATISEWERKSTTTGQRLFCIIDGELEQTVLRLKQLQFSLDEKIDNLGMQIKQLNQDEDYLKTSVFEANSIDPASWVKKKIEMWEVIWEQLAPDGHNYEEIEEKVLNRIRENLVWLDLSNRLAERVINFQERVVKELERAAILLERFSQMTKECPIL